MQARPSKCQRLLGMFAGMALWCLWQAPAVDAPAGRHTALALNVTPLPTAQLPEVARPFTAKPSVGLATDAYLDRTPPRQTKGLDLVKMGWSYNCMECHKLLPAKWHYDRPMAEHQNIILEHGENRFCLTCHHPTNRNAFVAYDGSEIAEADVVTLCAKCHGPTYRDWKAGVHGRRNGYWDVSKGARTQLRCIQCHDPHQPKFQSMPPLPPLKYPARAANPPANLHTTAKPHYYGDWEISDTRFPLTPALSLWERENCRQFCEQTKASIHQSADDGIPSPQGRGKKGEGKLVAELTFGVAYACDL